MEEEAAAESDFFEIFDRGAKERLVGRRQDSSLEPFAFLLSVANLGAILPVSVFCLAMAIYSPSIDVDVRIDCSAPDIISGLIGLFLLLSAAIQFPCFILGAGCESKPQVFVSASIFALIVICCFFLRVVR